MAWKSTPALWRKLKPVARKMRSEATPAEIILWTELSKKKFRGYRFLRQHAVGQFVLDFYCSALHFAIEVDGETHRFRRQEDASRDRFLNSNGLRVFRVHNEKVITDVSAVLADLERFIAGA
jgi:very-short-patch-repair endonuclease